MIFCCQLYNTGIFIPVWPSIGAEGVACMLYCVMRPFGVSGMLHVSNREVEVAVERVTLPTSVGARGRLRKVDTKKVNTCILYRQNILTTLLSIGRLPRTVGTASCIYSHNTVEVSCR